MRSLNEATLYDALRRDILNGVFAPGDPLRLSGLSQRYNVSATPLREALSRLEEKRLVVAHRNRGWQVAPISLAELEDIAAARLGLEEMMTAEAIDHGDLEWEAGIVASFHRLSQTDMALTGDASDRLAWRDAHDAFHHALLASVRSRRLRQTYGDLIEEMQRYHDVTIYAARPVLPEDGTLNAVHSLDAHAGLRDAFLGRDTARAQKLMRDHVNNTLVVYRSATRKQDTKTGANAT
ncbi:GntR family transcriptional regulator [Lutimaribacter marinistellae]|uniref:GntR family transcriptional regulator n=1 Tax=Lutimaribacter marinistellae TaxID=1820329 RepID=A0ABV7TGW7_9RHOB